MTNLGLVTRLGGSWHHWVAASPGWIHSWPSGLDQAGIIKVRPDYLWREGERVVATADAKYKRIEHQSHVPNEDLYQVLFYCSRYGSKIGYLLYAAAPDFSLHMAGSYIEIRIRSIDLSQDLASLHDNLESLHHEIVTSRDKSVGVWTTSREVVGNLDSKV